ncbi:DUF5330 domain-containing protein [Ancylobacter koreensis]|uniref:DUF5330 domain-containing protein n=1 Tax=Ancylobacter koreensis TaxID=266121 RepID=UPI00248C1A2A|nr:DUF5330 domain-containing protein [Ancylobacter koreensis]
MFFLLRIGFWLTLVFLLLPAVTGGPSSHAPQGEQKVSAVDALSAASSAVADAGGFCARQPQACVIGAGLIELIGERAEAGARFALSYISEQIVEEKRKAAARAAGAAPGDTLTTHDLSPAWKGPGAPAAAIPANASNEVTGSTGRAPANAPAAAPVPPAGMAVPLPPKRPA